MSELNGTTLGSSFFCVGVAIIIFRKALMKYDQALRGLIYGRKRVAKWRAGFPHQELMAVLTGLVFIISGAVVLIFSLFVGDIG